MIPLVLVHSPRSYMHLPRIYRFISPRVWQAKEKTIDIPCSSKKAVSAHLLSNQSLRTILPKYPSILWKKIHQPGYVTSPGPPCPPPALSDWVPHFLLPALASYRPRCRESSDRGRHLVLKLPTGWLHSPSPEKSLQTWGSIAQWTDGATALGMSRNHSERWLLIGILPLSSFRCPENAFSWIWDWMDWTPGPAMLGSAFSKQLILDGKYAYPWGSHQREEKASIGPVPLILFQPPILDAKLVQACLLQSFMARETVWPGWLHCYYGGTEPGRLPSEQVSVFLEVLCLTKEKQWALPRFSLSTMWVTLSLRTSLSMAMYLLFSSVTGQLSLCLLFSSPSVSPIPASQELPHPDSICWCIPHFNQWCAGAGSSWLKKAHGAYLFPMSCSAMSQG